MSDEQSTQILPTLPDGRGSDFFTFLLDPDESGQVKLKSQVIGKLLLKMPVQIIEPAKQVDQMTADELDVILRPAAA